MQRNVKVVPYRPHWISQFSEEAALIASALGGSAVAVHHIGSTSIPGLPAKPILDILVEARDIHQAGKLDHSMGSIGYRSMGEYGIPGRRFYIKGPDDCRTHHVHIFQQGSSQVQRHLAFRDYLRTHPLQAAEYGSLRQTLAEEFPFANESYMQGKDAFIREIDQQAASWQSLRTPLEQMATARLQLMALNAVQLRTCLEDPRQLEESLGVPISTEMLTSVVRRAISIKLNKMQNQPAELHPWLTYWLMVLPKPEFGVGLIGFKGEPDPDGRVEIGYGIDEHFRNRGLTTEAAAALLGWAFRHPGCQAVTASANALSNPASIRVLEKLGMQLEDDLDDNTSWVITRSEYQGRFPR